jgi:hypothetical protein
MVWSILHIIQYTKLDVYQRVEVLHHPTEKVILFPCLRLGSLLRRRLRILWSWSRLYRFHIVVAGVLRSGRGRGRQVRRWGWSGVIVHSLLNSLAGDLKLF